MQFIVKYNTICYQPINFGDLSKTEIPKLTNTIKY